ncbi:aldehyde ferredoxin oxidoreductase family protein [Chloroflexota bacterium]
MVFNAYGKILDVDLSSGKITKRDIDPEFARKFIGGMGFSCKFLYDEAGIDVDPLSPENVVIFAAGPLTGTGAPCGSRTEITTKSPLTGIIGSGNTGGLWGTRLRHTGFDTILVRGRAEKPVYIWIDNDRVEIREAGHLWGKDTQLTSAILRKELESSPLSRISVLTIGPAGENLVRYASVLNDYHHSASRCGTGAVMGAKRLKAIAVRGTGTVKIGRPQEFRKAIMEARERLLANDKAWKMPGAPTDPRTATVERGALPGKNFQTGTLPQWLETRGSDSAYEYFTKTESVCYACPVPCFNLVEVREGKYAGLKVNRGLMPGVVFDWGAKCAIDNLPAIWKCKELCESFGMDYASAAGCISFAMELFQRGILSKNDTDGLELNWGNEDAVIEMLHRIAFRKGFGDILAEGSLRAAKIIGKGTEQYVMATKGMEMMSSDPRTGTRGWVFGDLTNPRGGDNVKNTHFSADKYNHNWWVDKIDMFEDTKRKIYNMPSQELSNTWEGKALMCKWFEDLYSVLNALGLCFYTSARHALGPTHLSRLYSACTGWDTTPEDIMRSGEKVFTLLKVYNVRQGLTRKDDTWPSRFFTEPLPEGPSKGTVLSKNTIERLLDEYYELRGWDIKTGLPTKEKLIELGLGDVVTELISLGRIT